MKKVLFVFLLLPLMGIGVPAQTILQQFAAISSGAGTVSDMDLPQPTAKGSTIITMPLLLTPGVRVVSVTDDAPDGGNTYKQITGTVSSCAQQNQDIWYCENCKPGAAELKFHLSDHVRASINTFLEVSGLALSSVVDGSGVAVSDRRATSTGSQVGPSITTTVRDFVIARYFADAPLPTGVTPIAWTYTTSYVYALNVPSGTHQPTLTGAKPDSNYCISMAAFKIASDASTR